MEKGLAFASPFSEIDKLFYMFINLSLFPSRLWIVLQKTMKALIISLPHLSSFGMRINTYCSIFQPPPIPIITFDKVDSEKKSKNIS